MKRTILAVIIAVSSVSAFASDIAASHEAVAHANRFGDANTARMNASIKESVHANAFASMARDTYNNTKAPNRGVAAQAAQDAQSIANHMQAVVSNDAHQVAESSAAKAKANAAIAAAQASAPAAAPTAAPSQPSAPAAAPAAAPSSPTDVVGEALDGKQTNSAVNVAAGNLNPNMDVKTEAGVVKAGTLPADAQVKVGLDSVFAGAVRKGGNDHSRSSSRSEHGTGAGGQNAQNSRSAGNFGDNHVGGGSAQSGSRNVGHW